MSVKNYSPKDDFQEFTVNVSNDWIMKGQKSNVVFIVISKEKRKIAISVAGDVRNLNDKEAQDAISDAAIPELKKDRYFEGIKQGVGKLILKWK